MPLKDQQLKHIKDWQASGLTQTTYCQKHGLNKKTFSGWFVNYSALSKPSEPTLIAIAVKPSVTEQPAIAEPLRLRLSSGPLLEVPSSISPRWLAELLQCLG